MTDKIQTRLSDGLEHLALGEADTILIAGMGGGLVIHILSEHPKVAQAAKEMILQPQSEVYEVRKFLYDEGYETLSEDMVLEDGKFYPMMKVRYAKNESFARKSPTLAQLYFGELLLESKHPVLQEFLQRECRIQQEVLETLQAQKRTDAIEKRIEEVSAYLHVIRGCII